VSASRHRDGGRSEQPPAADPTLAARVRALLPGTSWERARTLCRGGKVRVDGRIATDPASRPAAASRVELVGAASAKGRGGDREDSPDATATQGDGGGSKHPLDATAPGGGDRQGPSLVVHADADVVVVRKPAGVLTVPFDRRDRDTLLALTRVALRRLEQRRGARVAGARPAAAGTAVANPTLRAVQRLDRDTSGLLVFARSVGAQRALQQQLARREVTRRYEALVHGAAADAVYDSWLVEDRGDGLRGSWRPGPGESEPPPGARRAVTRVQVLERLRGATRVACELATGRRHQIRIHLAEAGHPLVGEAVYVRDYRGQRLSAPRPMLHAAVLGFRHPRDGRPLRFEEPPPPDFAEMLERLRRRNPGR
jgi:23S rRNA pseudouridine1911/1915/1917 synthase